MKLAIIAVTNKGALLACKLEQYFRQQAIVSDIFLKEHRTAAMDDNASLSIRVYQSLSQLIAEIFPQYDSLLFIMATGIVVRVIAPYVVDKRSDPAVVVLDDGGQHAISLLSGHIGGANDLAKQAGQAVGATPVITTATDVAGKSAADVLAVKLKLAMEPFSLLKSINAAIVNGAVVPFYLDSFLANCQEYRKKACELGITLLPMAEKPRDNSYAVVITDKMLPHDANCLYLRPPTLAVGIGCRRGTSKQEILSAVKAACDTIGCSSKSIAVMASTVVKQEEAGLLAAIAELKTPAIFYEQDTLQQCIHEDGLKISDFVQKQIGVGNVCEAAASLAGQRNSLLLPKTKYPKVTIAIARAK